MSQFGDKSNGLICNMFYLYGKFLSSEFSLYNLHFKSAILSGHTLNIY